MAYRPFSKLKLYAEHPVVDRPGKFNESFPYQAEQCGKPLICLSDVGLRSPFSCLMTDHIAPTCISAPALTVFNASPSSPIPENGKDRRDNITPKALTLFQIFYGDDHITREEIFHYVYALLHHPSYRTRFAENFKRELPRIPFVGVVGSKIDNAAACCYTVSTVETMQKDAKPVHDLKASAELFHSFVDAGRKLANLHLNYETAKEFPLERHENTDNRLDWRVEAMKLSKDKTTLIYNDFLTLSGIPPETYDYRLGNRSALEWVLTNTASLATRKAKSSAIPTASTTSSTSCGWWDRSSPSASRPWRLSTTCRPSKRRKSLDRGDRA